MAFLRYKNHLSKGDYIGLTVGREPISGSRGRVLFFQCNDQIALVKRQEDIDSLLHRYARRLEILDPSQVPENIKAVLEGRISAAAAAAARDKAKRDTEKRSRERSKERQNAHPSASLAKRGKKRSAKPEPASPQDGEGEGDPAPKEE